jgi:hypothetical protein
MADQIERDEPQNDVSANLACRRPATCCRAKSSETGQLHFPL